MAIKVGGTTVIDDNRKIQNTGSLELEAISTTIADTAVDIFIYDTRKDSDGGAWRKRTQHTSWYNETLNTATRGSRREFPAVAVIVAEGNQVTIYDGDDPDLPMWMVFNRGGGWPSVATALGQAFAELISSVAIKNGRLVVAQAVNQGLRVIDFLRDDVYIYTDSALYLWAGGVISKRNSSATIYILDATIETVNGINNDVAMTVLPNAPIDSATGLPIPTIAVATDGGVSVIKDDGTVVDITTGDQYDVFHSLDFLGTDKLIIANETTASVNVDEISSADNTYSNYADHTGTTANRTIYRSTSTGVATIPSTVFSRYKSGQSVNSVKSISDSTAALADDQGTTILDHDNDSVVYITSSYNTGWMPGDIKLAALSDTDDTDVTGTELITNGTFDTDVSGWTSIYSTLSHQSGQAKVTASSSNILITQALSGLVVGKKYTATVTVTSFVGVSANLFYFFLSTGYSNNIGGAFTTDQVPQVVTTTFTATSTSHSISFGASSGSISAGEYALIDNFSVRLAEEDRSVNDNGLQVFGTVTKNPVATGADLVAYSGFSASNYLQQPYNADLQFGTGDFCINFWQKYSGLSRERSILSIGSWGGSSWSNGLIHIRHQDYDVLTVYLSDDGFATFDSFNSSALPRDVWNNIFLVRRNSKLYCYINGVLDSSVIISNASGNISTSNGTLLVGSVQSSISDYSYQEGSLALLRISATAPSPEQIKKIYEDEKELFQENAQATLYGSSDSVTALAYDDDTNLLHAGTSAGRSVFSGLRRVDNTTDAVGSAISASDGMVADD